MNAVLEHIAMQGQQVYWAAGICFLRVGAAMAVLPAFGERTVPQRVRLVIALCFTAVVFPAISAEIVSLVDANTFVVFVLFSEVVAGLVIGISLRLFVLALQTAGAIAAQSTSLSQLLGGSVEPAPAIGHLMLMSGLAFAVMLGLHVKMAEFLILSYDMMPPGQIIGAAAVAQWGTARVGQAFALAFTLSAPFVIASLIYNIALGVINRAMPQLMVAFVGAPAITAGGLMLLMVALPMLLSIWVSSLFGFMGNPFGGP